MNSVIGRNVINCSLRYNTTVDYISKLELSPHSIDKYSVLLRALNAVDIALRTCLFHFIDTICMLMYFENGTNKILTINNIPCK
jgi:hypothetical protein